MILLKRTIKVLYVQAFSGGGSLAALYDMINALDQKVVDPIVLCYFRNQYTDRLKDVSKVIYLEERCKIETAQSSSTIKSKFNGIISAQRRAYRQYFGVNRQVDAIYSVLSTERPDIVHHNNDSDANFASIKASSKAGIVSVLHNRSLKKYKRNPAAYLANFFSIRVPLFRIYITEAVQQHYNQLFFLNTRKSVVLHDFINISKLRQQASTENKTDSFIKKDDFVISNIGRIIEWKGQHVLLEALALLKPCLGNVKVLFVGSWEAGVGSAKYYERLKAMVKQYHLEAFVHFTGDRSDIGSIIRASDVIVHTAIEPEPQGLVIIESLICNKPVIASSAGGAKEIVEKYGGITVQPTNVKALANMLKKVFENKLSLSKMFPIHMDRLLRDFNADAQKDVLMEIYRNALKGAR